jgi:hypothetical protein
VKLTTVDDVKDDLAEAKKQLRIAVSENVAMKTQIASMEAKLKSLPSSNSSIF